VQACDYVLDKSDSYIYSFKITGVGVKSEIFSEALEITDYESW